MEKKREAIFYQYADVMNPDSESLVEKGKGLGGEPSDLHAHPHCLGMC